MIYGKVHKPYAKCHSPTAESFSAVMRSVQSSAWLVLQRLGLANADQDAEQACSFTVGIDRC